MESTSLYLFACWVFLLAFLQSADYFQKSSFQNESLRNTSIIRVSNSLDQNQARHFVGPDLGPNCLQRLSKAKVIQKLLLAKGRVNSLHVSVVC